MMEINLLPPINHWSRPVPSASWVPITVVVIIAVVAGVAGWVERQNAAASYHMSANLDEQAALLRQQLTSLQATSASSAPVTTNVSDLLSDVREVAPDGVSLLSVNWSNGQVTLSGQADTMAHLTAYARALAKLPECASVWVDSATHVQQGYQFTLHMGWKAGVP